MYVSICDNMYTYTFVSVGMCRYLLKYVLSGRPPLCILCVYYLGVCTLQVRIHVTLAYCRSVHAPEVCVNQEWIPARSVHTPD